MADLHTMAHVWPGPHNTFLCPGPGWLAGVSGWNAGVMPGLPPCSAPRTPRSTRHTCYTRRYANESREHSRGPGDTLEIRKTMKMIKIGKTGE